MLVSCLQVLGERLVPGRSALGRTRFGQSRRRAQPAGKSTRARVIRIALGASCRRPLFAFAKESVTLLLVVDSALDALVDDSNHPLIVLRAPPYITDQMVEIACSRLSELLERRERVAICWNFVGASMVTGNQRRRMMQFQRDELRRFEDCFIAEAYVVNSFFIKGAIVAVESFARPSYPTQSFREAAPALVWLRQMIERDVHRCGQ